jgi:hypothetical protein
MTCINEWALIAGQNSCPMCRGRLYQVEGAGSDREVRDENEDQDEINDEESDSDDEDTNWEERQGLGTGETWQRMLADDPQHAIAYTKNLWRALHTARHNPQIFDLENDRELRDITAIYACTSWPTAQEHFQMMREEKDDFLILNFPLVRLARSMIKIQSRPNYTSELGDSAALVWWKAIAHCPEASHLDMTLVEDSLTLNDAGDHHIVHWFSMLLGHEIFTQSAFWSAQNPLVNHRRCVQFLACIQGVPENKLSDFVSHLFVRFTAWVATRLRIQQDLYGCVLAAFCGHPRERELLPRLWNVARFRGEMGIEDGEMLTCQREQREIRARGEN